MIDDRDIEELLAIVDSGRQAWIGGELGYGPVLDTPQDEDMTIFGPFGGEAGRGPGLEERQKQAARLFHGGSGTTELVKSMVSGNLAVLVLVERNEAVVEGSEVPQRWALRTTQVFEKRDDGWVRLHRHADPLISLRSPAVTFEIART